MRPIIWTKRSFVILVCLLTFTLLAAGCGNQNVEGTPGTGGLKTESRTAAGFSTIVLKDVGEVIVEQTGTESLSVTSDNSILPVIETQVQDGRLILGLKPGVKVRDVTEITYRITVRDLQGVEISGAGKAQLNGINTDQLAITINGAGEVTASGQVNHQNVTVNDASNYRGDALASRTAEVDVNGSGRALVNASESLDAHASGAGSIRYLGNPTLQEQVDGAGSIKPQ